MNKEELLRLVRVFGDEWIARSQINAKERKEIVKNVIQHIQAQDNKLNAIRDLKNDYDPYLYEKLGIKVISTSELEEILKGNKNEN